MKAEIEMNAFSDVYDEYETLARENFIDQSRRRITREHVEKYLKPNSDILELNAGSGIDAAYFAQNGHSVLATDISSASENYIKAKARESRLDNLTFEHLSFSNLNKLSRNKFDYIFSNFGGLNCTDDLKDIFPQFSDLLQTGGFVTLVVMPKFYPWEMLSALKGSKNAFRRFRGNGTAIVGEETIPVLYHSPGDIKSAFPENFRHISTQNIGTFYPSAHFKSLQRYENAIRFLVKLDEILNRSWMMPKGIGDYFIITFQKTC